MFDTVVLSVLDKDQQEENQIVIPEYTAECNDAELSVVTCLDVYFKGY